MSKLGRKPKFKNDFEKLFNNILVLIEKGYSILNACKESKISTPTLFRLMSEVQHNQLKQSTHIRTKNKYNIIFYELCKLVEMGYTIEKACKKINISRDFIYKHISKQQKLELNQIRHSNTIAGAGKSTNKDYSYVYLNTEEIDC